MSNDATQVSSAPLNGRVYAVTGGAGALGAAVVRALSERGAHVVVLDRVAPTNQANSGKTETARAAGQAAPTTGASARGRITNVVVDLADERAVTAAYAALERLDGSIHCAGGFDMKPLTETTLADFEAMWCMNTVSCFLACREAVRAMRRTRASAETKSTHAAQPAQAAQRAQPTQAAQRAQPDLATQAVRGWIVNISARPAVLPSGGMCAYAASKAAVANLTQSLAAEVLSDGIMVNAVLPSIMDTPSNRAAMPKAEHAKWPRVDDVAAVIRALASPSNVLTSGALVPVYGSQ